MAAAGAVKETAAEADFAGTATEVAVRTMEAGPDTWAGAVYVMAPPEALALAESVPHAPGLQLERAQDTPLLCGSFATVAVNVFVCPGKSVADAGVTVTDVAPWGGGVLEGGGSPAWEGECALETEGTEAQPPARKAASRQSTATVMGARARARTQGSEFKVQILHFFPERHSVSKPTLF
jgi:hypothetical protein